MLNYKNRLERLTHQLGFDGDGDDDIIIILRWGDGDNDDFPDEAIELTRTQSGQLIQRHGVNTIPQHLRGEVIVRWPDQ